MSERTAIIAQAVLALADPDSHPSLRIVARLVLATASGKPARQLPGGREEVT
jgi:hypothetical protein